MTDRTVLAMDTQELVPSSQHYETKIIPETCQISTPVASGKQNFDKKTEDSASVSKNRRDAESGKQSHARNKREDYPCFKIKDSEKNTLCKQRSGAEEGAQELHILESIVAETEKTIKMEPMTPDSEVSRNRLRNSSDTPMEAAVNRKRHGEENADIQFKIKKIKSNDSCDSVCSGDLTNPNKKGSDKSNQEVRTPLKLSSKDFSKKGKVTEEQNQIFKLESHVNSNVHNEDLRTVNDPQTSGIKRKCDFTDDENLHSLKRHSATDITYSNCNTLPVDECFSKMSLQGFLNTDEQKKKTSSASINDALGDASAAEENVTLIEFKALITHRDNTTTVNSSSRELQNQSIPNFKRFKKVQSISKRYIPVELDVQDNMEADHGNQNVFLNFEPQQEAEAESEDEWTFGGTTWSCNEPPKL